MPFVKNKNGLWKTQLAAAELDAYYGNDTEHWVASLEHIKPACGYVFITHHFGNAKKKRLPHLVVSKSDTIGEIKAFIADHAGIPPKFQSLTMALFPCSNEGRPKQITTKISDNDLMSKYIEATLRPWFRFDCDVVFKVPVPTGEDDHTTDDGSPRRKWARLSPAVPAEAEAVGDGDNDLAEAAGDRGATPLQLQLLGHGEELLQLVLQQQQQQQRGTDARGADSEAQMPLQVLTPEQEQQLLGSGEGILCLLLLHQQQQVHNNLATNDGGNPRRKSPRLSPAASTANSEVQISPRRKSGRLSPAAGTASGMREEQMESDDPAHVMSALELYRAARTKNDRRRGNGNGGGSNGRAKAEQLGKRSIRGPVRQAEQFGITKRKAAAQQSLLDSVTFANIDHNAARRELASWGEDAEDAHPSQEPAAAPGTPTKSKKDIVRRFVSWIGYCTCSERHYPTIPPKCFSCEKFLHAPYWGEDAEDANPPLEAAGAPESAEDTESAHPPQEAAAAPKGLGTPTKSMKDIVRFMNWIGYCACSDRHDPAIEPHRCFSCAKYVHAPYWREDAEDANAPLEAAAAPESAEDAESAHRPKAAAAPESANKKGRLQKAWLQPFWQANTVDRKAATRGANRLRQLLEWGEVRE